MYRVCVCGCKSRNERKKWGRETSIALLEKSYYSFSFCKKKGAELSICLSTNDLSLYFYRSLSFKWNEWILVVNGLYNSDLIFFGENNLKIYNSTVFFFYLSIIFFLYYLLVFPCILRIRMVLVVWSGNNFLWNMKFSGG